MSLQRTIPASVRIHPTRRSVRMGRDQRRSNGRPSRLLDWTPWSEATWQPPRKAQWRRNGHTHTHKAATIQSARESRSKVRCRSSAASPGLSLNRQHPGTCVVSAAQMQREDKQREEAIAAAALGSPKSGAGRHWGRGRVACACARHSALPLTPVALVFSSDSLVVGMAERTHRSVKRGSGTRIGRDDRDDPSAHCRGWVCVCPCSRLSLVCPWHVAMCCCCCVSRLPLPRPIPPTPVGRLSSSVRSRSASR